MTIAIRRLLLAAAVIAGATRPAAAQDAVSVSYQYFNYAASGLGNHMPIGVAFDYAWRISGPWSLVGSLDWSRDADDYRFQFEPFLPVVDVHETLSMTTYAGGMRWSGAGDDAAFFQLLGGLTRTHSAIEQDGNDAGSDSLSDFMLQPGAGLIFPLSERWSAIGQIDYRMIFSVGSSDNGFRLAAGVRVKFGT